MQPITHTMNTVCIMYKYCNWGNRKSINHKHSKLSRTSEGYRSDKIPKQLLARYVRLLVLEKMTSAKDRTVEATTQAVNLKRYCEGHSISLNGPPNGSMPPVNGSRSMWSSAKSNRELKSSLLRPLVCMGFTRSRLGNVFATTTTTITIITGQH